MIATRHAVARSAAPDLDGRVLVLTSTARDAELAQSVLAATGIGVTVCSGFDGAVAGLSAGCATLLIAEEELTSSRTARLSRALREQPPWSDLPVLVLARPGADSREAGEAVQALGNVTLLERPLRVSTLLSAVRSAMRARQRQYEIRRHLEEHAKAEALLLEADRRKDEFLATLGHELRNPLAPLLNSLHLLKVSPGQDPVASRLTAVMERQVMHLARLVDDLLELSRVTRGLIEVRREALDLRAVAQSAIETARSAIEAAGHQLHVDEPTGPIMIDGDPVRLTQVFANLLGNATKYTNPGGHIWFAVRQEESRAIVSVRDSGIGIPRDYLESVFEMFTQVDRASRRSQGGLGIGLTLVKSLVTMHGGRVQARSEGIGRGSEFIVDLPLLPAAHPRAGADAVLEPFPSRRVLVVDDNEDAADSLGDLLEALGCVVSVAHGGETALQALVDFGPDVVLLDIGMPGMDGYEVARRMRAMPEGAGVMLVALTGWGQLEDEYRAREAGFALHTVKPLGLAALRQVLVRAL